jgi:predicted ATPase
MARFHFSLYGASLATVTNGGVQKRRLFLQRTPRRRTLHLRHLSIHNFRALEGIEVDFQSGINVIVGPNAVGKTTIMEAVRLSKALLAPRSGQEQTQVLHSLGASSPHVAQRIFMDVLARDMSRPVSIATTYTLHEDEIQFLRDNRQQIASTAVQSQLGQVFASPAAIIQHLSSDAGRKQLEEAESAIHNAVEGVARTNSCELVLTIDPRTMRLSGNDALQQLLIGVLDQRLPPYQAAFSYFPADRAFPSGEQPIQIGSQDTPAQLESHNSQPQLKFSRLKHSIITSLIQDEKSRAALETDFRQIFERLLTGRSFSSVGIRPELGLVSIKVQDDATGAIFDLDGMSSGEKGVIMTFFLIARSIADHGMILFDEPELHLNPAVCRDILSFMFESYVIPKDMQVILCTHSPEILSSALDIPKCSLFHLRSPSLITPVRPKDTDEVAVALRLLGASELDNLMYRGLLFVEGDDDMEILQAGFPDQLSRIKVAQLGGRREIERHIAQLQSAEARGADLTRTALIFDRDTSPTGLKSSQQVRVAQWDRYCIENYLLDADTLVDFFKSGEYVAQPVPNIGEVQQLLKRLAFVQIDALAARQVYASYGYPNVGIRSSELDSRNTSAIADALCTRLMEARTTFASINIATWRQQFITDASERANALKKEWQARWLDLCNGKQVFVELQRALGIRMNLRKFKKLIVQEMRARRTVDHAAMASVLRTLFSSP